MNLYIIEYEDPEKRGEADETTMMYFRAESAEHALTLLIVDLGRIEHGDHQKLDAKLKEIQKIYVNDLATNVDGEAGWAIPTTEVTFDVTQALRKKPRRLM